VTVLGCGGRAPAVPPHPAAVAPPFGSRSTIAGRPPLALIARDGDGRGAFAVAVTTDGLAEERGALSAVALAALVEARLAARGVTATVMAGWNGYRLRALVEAPAQVPALVEAVRSAMLEPVAADDPALPAVMRKATALARRPLPDPSLADRAACTGDVYGVRGTELPAAADVEAWRRSSHGLGRVALAVAGDRATGEASLRALSATAPWPAAAPVRAQAWPPVDDRATVYDASGEIPAGSARIIVTARTVDAERAVAAAADLADPRGPLASRLAALEAPARVRSVAATAHVAGGCLAATLDIAPRDVASDLPGRVATAAALARQEIAVEIADTPVSSALGPSLAARAADPRDAAERAAWWTLAGRAPGDVVSDARTKITVGVASPKDARDPIAAASADAIRSEIDRAGLAWHAPVVEKRARIEPGQGELWILLASPCGTQSESVDDAGVGAEVATAAAASALEAASDASAEPFVSVDGIGILVHGPARPGERPQAHARRLADLAARAFAADALDTRRISDARTTLLARAADPGARSLAALGGALSRGHPSWVQPLGTGPGLSSASDEAIAVRAAAMRAGPMRLAVLSNVDAAQADAAARSVDRWVARAPGEARACTTPPVVPAPRPGTYAVELPPGAPSEAVLAAALPAGDPSVLVRAGWLAAALDGPDGLLARALGGGTQEGAPPPLARSWSATVLTESHPPALAVRVTAPDASLDAAVAQVRVLMDRVRQGALSEEDRRRAGVAIARERLSASLDPRARTIELWRGESNAPEPSLDGMRDVAAAVLHDEALVIVAARPARIEPARPNPARESKGRVRL
jgi:hypothetical protein